MPDSTSSPRLTPSQARGKIEYYCAYRERSQVEVREKLYQYGLTPPEVEQLIAELIEGNFLNEERFACAYVRGKFEQKKWGRLKISQGLYRHKISPYLLKKAFAQIDAQDYQQTLSAILVKKWRSLKVGNSFQKKGRVAVYAISRGFESDLVWDELTNLYPD